MSDNVSLNAAQSGAQHSDWTISATDNGTPFPPSVTFSSDNANALGISVLGVATARFTGAPDPSGTGSVIVNVTGTLDAGQPGAGQSITRQVTVVTIGDTVVLTGDFSAPAP